MLSTGFILSTLLVATRLSRAEPIRSVSINPGGPMIPACPTVTTTARVCRTCAVPDCIELSTIVNPTVCPRKIPTVTASYPCSKSSCPGCKTEYVYASTFGQPPTTTSPTTTSPTTTPCPTVTSVLGFCSTCVMPMCEAISTIRSVCGCPSVVPTVTTSHGCQEGCVGGCAGTMYVYDTVTPSCTARPTKYY